MPKPKDVPAARMTSSARPAARAHSQPGLPDGRIVGPGTLATVEVALHASSRSAGSGRQVGQREPDAVVVGGGPSGLIDLLSDLFDRVSVVVDGSRASAVSAAASSPLSTSLT